MSDAKTDVKTSTPDVCKRCKESVITVDRGGLCGECSNQHTLELLQLIAQLSEPHPLELLNERYKKAKTCPEERRKITEEINEIKKQQAAYEKWYLEQINNKPS